MFARVALCPSVPPQNVPERLCVALSVSVCPLIAVCVHWYSVPVCLKVSLSVP